jgi:polysaccharide export outer membrane protein
MSVLSQPVEKVYINRIQLILLAVLISLAFGCGSKKSILFRTNDGKALLSTLGNSESSDTPIYSRQIKGGDILTITNLSNDDLINGQGSSTPLVITYEVNENGKVKLPTIGEVPIGGLRIKEAEELVNNVYKKNILANPLFVITIQNSKVTLLGEFFKQGNFILENYNTSLINVLGEAGGFSLRADMTSVKIIRGDKSNPEVIDVDLTNIASLASPKLQLRDGDIIYSKPKNIYLFSDKISPVLAYVGIGTSLLSLIFLFTRN